METATHSIPTGPTGKLENNIAAPYQFSVCEVIKESWHRVKGVKMTYWGAVFIFLAIYVALSLLAGLSIAFYSQFVNPENLKVPFSISKTVISLITLPLPFGISYLAIRRSVNLPINVKQIFESYRYYGKILLVMVALYVVLFFIVTATVFLSAFFNQFVSNMSPSWLHYYPVLIQVLGAVITLYFIYSMVNAPLLIIEKKLNPLQAMKASILSFSQHGFKILLTLLCVFVICFISLIPLGIGLIWTLPMMYNAIGVLYRIQFGVNENTH